MEMMMDPIEAHYRAHYQLKAQPHQNGL